MLRVGALLAALTACAAPLSPGELRLLALGERQWAARGFPDYAIEMRTSCFCPPEINDWARVEVRSGQVQRVTLLATGTVITDSRLGSWSTVEAIFAQIRRANDEDYLDDLRFTLDPQLGFPTLVEWLPSPGIQDAGATLSLRNATPLP